MKGIFFVLSILSFSSSLYLFLSIKKPGVYPPKYILKKRSKALAMIGFVFLFIGLII